MASLLPSSLRLSPKLPQTLTLIPKSPFLSTARLLQSPAAISFQRLQRSNLSPKIKSQHQALDRSLLPQGLQDIVSLFQSVEDPKAKYHQLLHYASQLPPLDPRFKTDQNRVRGCVSQVWVRAYVNSDDPTLVMFEADSDSVLTKGLAALLVNGLSGSKAEVIAGVPVEFVQLLGLRQSLTPSRNNGFLNMLKLMQKKAVEIGGGENYEVLGGKDSILEGGGSGAEKGVSREQLAVNGNGFLTVGEVLEVRDSNLEVNGGLVTGVEEDVIEISSNGRAERIRRRMEEELSPVELELEDISYQHAGHAGAKGVSGGDTHFNLRIVSSKFEGKSLVKRHRLVYDLLQEELQTGLHALSIIAKTPSEV